MNNEPIAKKESDLKNESDLKETNLKKELAFKDVLGIGVGQTIGAGVMAMTGIAIGMTGTGAVLAYVISSILVILISIPTMVMSSTLPTTGGSYKYSSRLLSPRAGLFYIFIYMAYNITLSLFAISFAEYMQAIVPAIPFKLAAGGLLTLFYIFNLTGIKSAARLQNIMVIIMAISFALFIGYGMPEVDFSVYNAKEMMPSGFVGLLTVSGLLTFATGGANVVVNLGGEMKNPGRDIPLSMAIATVLVGIIYALMAFVASGVLPVEQVAYKNLTEVAQTILPGPLFTFFIVGGAMFAIATTLNSTFSWVTKPILSCCEDGWLPAKLGEVNKKFGTPHYLLTIFYIIGIIPVITGISLTAVGTIGSGVALFMALIPIIASFKLHKKYPEACKKAPFMLEPKLLRFTSIIAFILCLFQSVLLFSTLSKSGIIMAIAYAIIAYIVAAIIAKKKNVNLYTGDAKKDFGL